MPDEPTPAPRVTIRVKRNGPYIIELDDAPRVAVVNQAGESVVPAPGRRIALCRCGGSSTKPFCDGTHRRNGFTDPSGSAPEAGGAAEGPV